MQYYYIDGSTGAILRQIDVSPWGHGAYGAVLDRYGVLWFSGNPGPDLRIDLSTDPPGITNWNPGHFVYGIGLDYLDHIFGTGWSDYKLSRVNILTGAADWTQDKPEAGGSRGVVCTSDNDVWVANSFMNTVTRYDNDGNLLATIPVGAEPTGVAVDADGKVWVCDGRDENIHRIDPATNTVDLTKQIVGSGGHYSYSDMTGHISRTVTARKGSWTVIHDSQVYGAPWGVISWSSHEPTGTSLTVEVRSTDDDNLAGWSGWETAINGERLSQTPNGRYLEVKVTFRITDPNTTKSPILYDLTIGGAILKVKPEVSYVPQNGGMVSVEIVVENVVNLHGVNFSLYFNESINGAILEFVSIDQGSFLKSAGKTVFMSKVVANRVNVSTALLGAGVGANGTGAIAVLTFKVAAPWLLPADLDLTDASLIDSWNNPIPAITQDGWIDSLGMPFDGNFDCQIDYLDLFAFSTSWHCYLRTPCFNPVMDCPADGKIDYLDLFNFSMVWGLTCWHPLPISCNSPVPAPERSSEGGAETAGSRIHLDFDPAAFSQAEDRTIEVNIVADQVTDLHGINIDLSFDSQQLEVIEAEKGDLVSGMPFFQVDTRQAGLINLAGTFLGREPGVSGSGVLAKVVFKVNNPEAASTELKFDQVIVADHNNTHYDLTSEAVGTVLSLRNFMIPTRTLLSQNYPNPLNPETWIPFSLSTRADVTVNIYSLSGELIRSVDLGRMEAGYYTAKGGLKSAAYWDGKDKADEEVSSGIYLYQLRAGSFVSTRKMIVLK